MLVYDLDVLFLFLVFVSDLELFRLELGEFLVEVTVLVGELALFKTGFELMIGEFLS